ncbi:hypothetical protein CBR_g9130 [Chara braunii]|uniref:Cyclin N-terminal domain-containing protein n=1 Tax=Chara braunii TaxID=69332 RepID=A0A388KNT7_CHABU|nr:hypothetical protein CBR_g9130 [Chara braunii]|eukprot:GBG71719.1 hypothetical protein CBR_g9130 [Chara braunii]
MRRMANLMRRRSGGETSGGSILQHGALPPCFAKSMQFEEDEGSQHPSDLDASEWCLSSDSSSAGVDEAKENMALSFATKTHSIAIVLTSDGGRPGGGPLVHRQVLQPRKLGEGGSGGQETLIVGQRCGDVEMTDDEDDDDDEEEDFDEDDEDDEEGGEEEEEESEEEEEEDENDGKENIEVAEELALGRDVGSSSGGEKKRKWATFLQIDEKKMGTEEEDGWFSGRRVVRPALELKSSCDWILRGGAFQKGDDSDNKPREGEEEEQKKEREEEGEVLRLGTSVGVGTTPTSSGGGTKRKFQTMAKEEGGVGGGKECGRRGFPPGIGVALGVGVGGQVGGVEDAAQTSWGDGGAVEDDESLGKEKVPKKLQLATASASVLPMEYLSREAESAYIDTLGKEVVRGGGGGGGGDVSSSPTDAGSNSSKVVLGVLSCRRGDWTSLESCSNEGGVEDRETHTKGESEGGGGGLGVIESKRSVLALLPLLPPPPPRSSSPPRSSCPPLLNFPISRSIGGVDDGAPCSTGIITPSTDGIVPVQAGAGGGRGVGGGGGGGEAAGGDAAETAAESSDFSVVCSEEDLECLVPTPIHGRGVEALSIPPTSHVLPHSAAAGYGGRDLLSVAVGILNAAAAAGIHASTGDLCVADGYGVGDGDGQEAEEVGGHLRLYEGSSVRLLSSTISPSSSVPAEERSARINSTAADSSATSSCVVEDDRYHSGNNNAEPARSDGYGVAGDGHHYQVGSSPCEGGGRRSSQLCLDSDGAASNSRRRCSSWTCTSFQSMQATTEGQNSKYLKCLEYEEDILTNYLERESRRPLPYGYLSPCRQPHIAALHRRMMMKWLMEFVIEFHLRLESLFLGAAILDRYLADEQTPLPRSLLQLLGVASMVVAVKFEETVSPNMLQDCCEVVDHTLTPKHILMMETKVLRVLKFDCHMPTAHTFLWMYLQAGNADRCLQEMAEYLCCMSLLDYELLKFRPSVIARASLLLASHFLNRERLPSNCLQRLFNLCASKDGDIGSIREYWSHLPGNVVDNQFSHNGCTSHASTVYCHGET